MFGFFLVMPLVIIIAVGNILKRFGFYSQSDISALSKTLYWIILPPLLFRTTYIAGAELLEQPNLMIAVNICYFVTIAASWLGGALYVHKGNVKRTAVSVLSGFRANNIYLGFPVIQLAMGDNGIHLASVYIAVSTIFFQVLSIGGGEIALNGRITGRSFLEMVKRLCRNPLIVSCVAGVCAAVAGLPLHMVFDETFKLMGNAATAVALLALGGSLDISRMGRIVKIMRNTWFDILIKLVFNPLVMCGALMLFPVQRDLAQVTVMLSSMPCAVNCFIVAKGMGMDSEYAADLVASTTLLGIISIPFWAYALGIV